MFWDPVLVYIIRSGLPDLFLLVGVHRLLRIAILRVFPVFHFHKYQSFSLFGDQVDLASPVPEILLQDPVSISLQKGSRFFFVTAAHCSLILQFFSTPFNRNF